MALSHHVRIPDAVEYGVQEGLVTAIPVVSGACFNPGIVAPS